jgi:hypothetical protein
LRFRPPPYLHHRENGITPRLPVGLDFRLSCRKTTLPLSGLSQLPSSRYHKYTSEMKEGRSIAAKTFSIYHSKNVVLENVLDLLLRKRRSLVRLWRLVSFSLAATLRSEYAADVAGRARAGTQWMRVCAASPTTTDCRQDAVHLRALFELRDGLGRRGIRRSGHLRRRRPIPRVKLASERRPHRGKAGGCC